MQVCPNCGEENPDKFRLCGICGTQLAVSIPAQETRKMVTVVFCDLKGSTSLGERLDTESLREVLAHYFTQMKTVLERHGGTVEKYIGDAIMAVFGLPRLHEDDALRAVRAALEMKAELGSVNEELERRWGVRLANRTGVNTGEVVAGDVTTGQRLVTGDTVNVAARLEQAAPEYEVLVGESTYRLVRDSVEVEELEPLELKGKAERVPAYRLISVKEGEAVPRRLDTPMLGRDAELASLMGRFDRAVGERKCQLVTVVGDAGVGKTRLIHEFLATVRDRASIVRGHCLPYGEGITFWPLAEVVREAAGIGPEDETEQARKKLAALVDDAVYQRVAATIGFTLEAFPLEETFWGARKFLETLAADRPLVMWIDDIHWAEPTFLDLLEHILDAITEASVVVVCSARHELVDERPTWATDSPNAERMPLEPLSEEVSADVIGNLLGGSPIPDELRERIIKAAEGNPLFVEQMLSVLIDEGLIRRGTDGTWAVGTEIGSFEMPLTIHALISARLDRLGVEEKAVAERGSVVGPLFYGGAVMALAPEELRPRVDPSLTRLIRKQLIRPDVSDLVGEDAYRFHHVLIRDAAYQGLLKRARIEMHESFAGWLESAAGTLIEFEEILGYHLEQAYRYRTELGTVDDQARAVGLRAAQLLSSAGKRAFARGDIPAAANLLQRASDVLVEDQPLRFAVMADLGEVLKDLGEFTKAEAALTEAIGGAVLLGDRRLSTQATIVRQFVRFWADPQLGAEQVLHEVEEALPVLEEVGDPVELAKAWRLIGYFHATAGRYGIAEQAVVQAINHARSAGDRRLEIRNLPIYATCAVYGPTTVAEGILQCEHMLEQAIGERRPEALLRLALSQLRGMQGDFDAARRQYRSAREILVDLGDRVLAATTSIDSGRVEMLAEDFEAAEAELRRDFQDLEAMGEQYYRATVAGLLAHALYLQGRDDEAEAFARITESTDVDDVESQSLWRRARARVLARRDHSDDAEALGLEALKLVEDIDSPVTRANTLLDLAEVLELLGRPTEAVPLIREALGLFDKKGNVVFAARARRRLQDLGVQTGAAPEGS